MKKNILFFTTLGTILIAIFFYFNHTGQTKQLQLEQPMIALEDPAEKEEPKKETFAQIPREPNENAPEIDNVVLITIDTLRADHLGYMGYPRNTSPFLDELAKKNILFKNNFTNIPSTNPSHASIFTGIYALAHKVSNNYEALDDSFETMAELFKSKGFYTAAFMGIPDFFKRGNLQQGFDDFIFIASEEVNDARLAQKTIDSAIKQLESNNTEKKFTWLHFFDLHFPYATRTNDGYIKPFKTPLSDKEKFLNLWTKEQGINREIFLDDKDQKLTEAMDAYDTEMAVIDQEIRRFYEYFEKNNLNEKTLWIITSDHGEGLGSHDFYLHSGRIYNEQQQTPLVFSFPPGYVNSPQQIDELIENVDILPTLQEIFGFKIKNHTEKISGQSLFPLIDGTGKLSEDTSFSWTGNIRGGTNGMNFKSPVGVFVSASNFAGEKFGLQNSNYKYIHNFIGEDEFYDLKNDPLEKNNLRETNIPEKQALKKELETKITQLQKISSDIMPIPIDIIPQ